MPPTAPLGYYWGDDAYGVARGPEALGRRLAGDGEPLERVRLSGNTTTADEIAEKVATATFFGGGTLVVVSEPARLISTKPLAARMAATLESVAAGNGLAFLDIVDGTDRRPASLDNLRKAVEAAGGETREFRAPTQDGMARWIADRARERDIKIAPAAATELARRVGANVGERDINRSRQGEIAVAELEKLALYRLDRQIGPEDVKALVVEAVPGSTWAFLDAIGLRRVDVAADLAEKLDNVPGPLLVTQLHRRMKDLVDVADLLSRGVPAATLVRTLKLHPYVAEKLATQARTWALPELDAAMAGLLELDATLKNREGGSDARRRAAIALWIAEKVRRPGQH
jgi:DNA polymerase-3 subunit delta